MKVHFDRNRFLAGAASAALAVGVITAPLAGQAASASAASSVVHVPVFTVPLKKVGQVNLGALARSEHRKPVASRRQGAPLSRAAARRARYRAVDSTLITHALRGTPATTPNPPTTRLSRANVPGEHGFSALTNVLQAQTNGGFDLEPPDQGLCAGGGYVMEFVNNALAIYNKNGNQLVAPIGSANVFGQPTTDFFSDPRCYYDAPTKRWFLPGVHRRHGQRAGRWSPRAPSSRR